jgi:hypothetical protein
MNLVGFVVCLTVLLVHLNISRSHILCIAYLIILLFLAWEPRYNDLMTLSRYNLASSLHSFTISPAGFNSLTSPSQVQYRFPLTLQLSLRPHSLYELP